MPKPSDDSPGIQEQKRSSNSKRSRRQRNHELAAAVPHDEGESVSLALQQKLRRLQLPQLHVRHQQDQGIDRASGCVQGVQHHQLVHPRILVLRPDRRIQPRLPLFDEQLDKHGQVVLQNHSRVHKPKSLQVRPVSDRSVLQGRRRILSALAAREGVAGQEDRKGKRQGFEQNREDPADQNDG